MGRFQVDIGIGHPRGGDLIDVQAVVDTGATHTVLPQSLLDQLHVEPLDHRNVVMADGSIRNMGLGEARIAYGGMEWTCPVLFGVEGKFLLGATTLEICNLVVDPIHQRLTPVEFLHA